MTTPQPLFKAMDPNVQALYDSIMQHGDNCEADIAVHEQNAMLVSFMMGSHMQGMQGAMVHLAKQSRLLEEEAREMAYLLLKPA